MEIATITRDGTIKCKITSARDRNAAGWLYELDDKVNALYRKHPNEAISTPTDPQKQEQIPEPRCYISALLILSYLERISDHACYVGDFFHYIVTGTPGRNANCRKNNNITFEWIKI